MRNSKDLEVQSLALFITVLLLTLLVTLWPLRAYPEASASLAPAAASSPASSAASSKTLSLKSISLSPETPGPDTLCELRVQIENQGTEAASELSFRVTVNGTELEAYRDRAFFSRIPPGETAEIRLYNFWSTETDRPKLEGSLTVDVELVRARWFRVGPDAEGVETWTATGEVEALPLRQSSTVRVAVAQNG